MLFGVFRMLAAQVSPFGAQAARTLFDQGKYSESAAVLENADRNGPIAPADLVLLGMCYTELAQYDKAAAALDRAAKLEPSSSPLATARGNLAFMQKRYGDAAELFRTALALDAKNRNALSGLTASLTNRGVELTAQGKTEDARASFLQALKADPASAAALRNIAVLDLQTGGTKEAKGYLEKALAASPKDVQLLKLLFIAQNRLEDAPAMLITIDRLIAEQPDDPENWAVKGRVLEAAGRQKEAEQAFRQAVAKGTRDPLAYYRIAVVSRDRYLLHDAIGKAVQLIGALELEASQAAGKIKVKEDVSQLKLLTTQADEVRSTLTSSVSLLRDIDGDAAFEQDMTRLQSWYPGSADIQAALGRFYAEKSRWEDAVSVWRRILADRPLDAEAQRGLGAALEKTGDRAGAITAYLKALDNQAGSEEIYGALERLFAEDKPALYRIFLDRSYRDTRNILLLKELVKIETDLGLARQAEDRQTRIDQILSGK